MRNLSKAMLLTYALAATAAILPTAAYASPGAVKVACGQNNCDNVNLGEICDTFQLGYVPVGLSCGNVATPGSGILKSCGAGGGTCRMFFSLVRSHLLGAYCHASGNAGANDALVMCDAPEAIRAVNEAEGNDSNEDQ